MEAVSAEFPTVKLLVYHGPYVSEPATPHRVRAHQSREDGAKLAGPLFVGFLEGLDPRATLIDGGELYALRSEEEFHLSYECRRRGITSDETDSAFIPLAVRAARPERVEIAFGVYNRPFPNLEPVAMDATIMRATLENALRHTDECVWFYAEEDN